MQAIGINRVLFERGVTLEELTEFVRAVSQPSPAALRGAEAGQDAEVDVDFIRSRMCARAGSRWTPPRGSGARAPSRSSRSTAARSKPRAWCGEHAGRRRARHPGRQEAVEHLADAVDTSRATMIGLTGMKAHDEYTFSHMVKRVDPHDGPGPDVRHRGRGAARAGLSAMLHDIGKVRTPLEVLNKPGALTPEERTIMRRHPVDAPRSSAGRRHARLAAVVAFEHHLRLDGSGYPGGVRRAPLNLARSCARSPTSTTRCGRRGSTSRHPGARIMEIMATNTGLQYDRHLVRRLSA